MNNYEWLIGRLDAFIRKYYANKVIRGSLVFLTCVLFYFLTVSVSEYFLYLPVWLKVTLVSLFLLLGSAALIVWVAIPLARMGRLGKVISHEQAAQIIGRHFPEVSDRLLNILQLKRHPDSNGSRELAEASISQKISQISVVPMTGAIDLSKNRKYLPFLLPLVLIGVFILVAAPNVFREGSSRLMQPTTAFEKPAPFRFIIKNASLVAIRNADFTVTVEVHGSALPAEAFIETGTEKVPMQPLANNTFQYTFRNITDPVNFRFFGAGFYSGQHSLKVVQRPVLKAFKVQLGYPAYTGKKSETRNSLSDMTVPAGTIVTWAFVTDHTDGATIRFGNGGPLPLQGSASMYGYQFRFMNDTAYTISLLNRTAGVADSFRYQVQVIPDQYPVIQLQQFRDTVSGKQVLITGTAGDDYGITRVTFNYEIAGKDHEVARKSIPVHCTPGALTAFQQYLDIQSLNLKPGQKLSYYIEAWDNDGVHGPKSSRSEVMTYFMYNEEQIDSAINANSNQINSGISSSSERTKQLTGEYKDMQTKMLQSDNMDWQQQQSLQDMMKKQTDLKSQLEAIKQRFEEQMQQTEQKKYSDNLKEKQQELDKQMDNLLNNELKEEMKKLQELMQKLNKENALEAMQKMEQDNKLFKMDMERMQELMKKMEMQMRMEDMANKMDELAKKERKLQGETEKADKQDKLPGDKNADDKKNADAAKDKTAADQKNGDAKDKDKDKTADNAMNTDKKDGAGKEKTAAESAKDQKGRDQKDQADEKKMAGKDQKESGKKDDEALKKEQKELRDQLEKAMKEDMKETQQLAKDTKQDDKLQDEEKQGSDAAKDMQDSEEELGQKQHKKASKSQKQAADNLEDMARSLRKKAGGGPEELDIDIRATRQVLSNLIRLSFDQEDLIDEVRHTTTFSQAYINNQEQQNKLHNNSLMIRDSLFALSKRVEKLAPNINKETSDLEYNMKKAVRELENRNVSAALADQQYVMTYTNNLALMLNEVLANLMQMEADAKKQPGGPNSCQMPGGKKPKAGSGMQLADIITEQKKLGNAMQQMQQSQGMKKNGNRPGEKEGESKGNKPGGQSQGANQGTNQSGEYGDAEQLARLAEQQASIRRQIQELSSLLNSKGLGNAKELREIEQKMDKTETDLVNRKTGAELMLRQKEIETRMLEVEKSLREQEQDDKRSSKSAQEISRPLPPALQKYITDQRQLLELYKTVPPQLKAYYREMVESYFHIIGNK